MPQTAFFDQKVVYTSLIKYNLLICAYVHTFLFPLNQKFNVTRNTTLIAQRRLYCFQHSIYKKFYDDPNSHRLVLINIFNYELSFVVIPFPKEKRMRCVQKYFLRNFMLNEHHKLLVLVNIFHIHLKEAAEFARND